MNIQKYKVETLSKGIKIYVNNCHKFGTDAVLLADFAISNRVENACDFGTGCGIIPFLWLNSNKINHVTGVEIQENACSMANRAIIDNCLQNRFLLLHKDLKDLKGVIKPGSMDLVTMNPPYQAAGTGILSRYASDRIARHETACTFEDVVNSAACILKFGGRLCMCCRPERLCDLLCAMRGGQCEPKRVRFVQQTPKSAPWLVLAEGKRGGKPGLTLMPPLVLTGEICREELQHIYDGYAL